MRSIRKDGVSWLLLPAVLLTLSSVTLLAPRQAAQAAPQAAQAAPKPPTPVIDDDGDGDELLEHWGAPQYAREERLQLAGIGGGFILLVGFAYRKRTRRQPQAVPLSLGDATEQRRAA